MARGNPDKNKRHHKKAQINNQTLRNQGFLIGAMEYIQIDFQNITSEQSELLIAELTMIGFEGFEEGDPAQGGAVETDCQYGFQ